MKSFATFYGNNHVNDTIVVQRKEIVAKYFCFNDAKIPTNLKPICSSFDPDFDQCNFGEIWKCLRWPISVKFPNYSVRIRRSTCTSPESRDQWTMLDQVGITTNKVKVIYFELTSNKSPNCEII